MRPNHWLEEDAARTAAPLTLALGARPIKDRGYAMREENLRSGLAS